MPDRTRKGTKMKRSIVLAFLVLSGCAAGGAVGGAGAVAMGVLASTQQAQIVLTTVEQAACGAQAGANALNVAATSANEPVIALAASRASVYTGNFCTWSKAP